MADTVPTFLEKAFVREQSTYDAFEAFDQFDAVSPVKGTLELEPVQNVSDLNEAVGSASYQGSTLTNRGVAWKSIFKVKPRAAGTPPDIRSLLKATFGVETVGADVQYTLSDSVTPPALQITKHLEGYLQENGSGCRVNECTIKVVSNEDPTFEFSGDGARYGRVSKDVIGTGGVATSATSCPLNNASRGSFIEPALVQIGDDDNSAAGYVVTDHDDTDGAADFTFSPGLAGAGESAGEDVLPFAPTRDVGGTVLAGINNALTIDGLSLGFIEATVKITTAYMLRDKEATTDRPSGISLARERAIEFEISGYFTVGATGSAPTAGRAFDKAVHDIDLTIGNAAGKRMKISIPAGEGRVNTVEYPENELVMITISGRAKQSVAVADELVLTFD